MCEREREREKSTTLYQNLIFFFFFFFFAEKCLLQSQWVGNGHQNFYQAMLGHRIHSYRVSSKPAQLSRGSSQANRGTDRLTDRETLVIYY